MSANTQEDLDNRLRVGIDLAKKGQREAAYRAFSEIVKIQPTHEQALIWKAAVSPELNETVACLELVLKISPANERAKAGLEWARKQQKDTARNAPVVEKESKKNPVIQEVLAKTLQNETKVEVAPYKKSRLPAQPSLLEKAAQLHSKKMGNGSAGNREKQQKVEKENNNDSVLMQAALPRIPLRISEKLRRVGAETQHEIIPVRVSLIWPLLLLLLAVGLAFTSFVSVQLAPVLGISTLLVTLVAILLLSRADF
jgi:tetratricopeptide (TPR) repeat protein